MYARSKMVFLEDDGKILTALSSTD